MNREYFDLLSQRIITSIGESKLKSEANIDAFLKGKDNMYDVNLLITGGYISGEIKLGVTLSLLAGDGALDLGAIFDIASKTCHNIFYEVLLH